MHATSASWIRCRQLVRRANYSVAIASYALCKAIGIDKWVTDAVADDFRNVTGVTPEPIEKHAALLKEAGEASAKNTIAAVGH